MKYSHIKEALGEQSFEALRSKTVSIVGLGGIGSCLAEMFVRAGVNVRLIEKDRVEEADLDRLSLFGEADITKFKATQAKKYLSKLNSDVKIKSFNEELTEDSLFLVDADIVCECTANNDLFKLISDYCVKQSIPCVHGEVRDHNCVVSWSSDKKGAFDFLSDLDVNKSKGLIPSSTHITASLMFVVAIKLLLGVDLKKNLLVFDSWNQVI